MCCIWTPQRAHRGAVRLAAPLPQPAAPRAAADKHRVGKPWLQRWAAATRKPTTTLMAWTNPSAIPAMARARKKTDPNKGGALQMSFFMPESKWKLPNISDLPSWRGAKRVAIDAETFDRDLTTLGPGTMRDGRTVGWAFAIEGGPKHYLPFRHEG